MKKLIMMVIAVLFVTTSGFASGLDTIWAVSIQNDIVEIDLTRTDKDFKYIEIKTSKSLFRIYPCGKIEKKEWKEIHPNEDNSGNAEWIVFGELSTETVTLEYNPDEADIDIETLQNLIE